MEIRRNSHYGQSPIAYPLNLSLLFSWAVEKFCNVIFACPFLQARFLFQEVFMKKFLTVLASVLTVFACCFLVACQNNAPVKADENTVIITATDPSFNFDGKTLKDYMDHLQDNGKLEFTVKDGMVTAVNGKSNTTKSFWMLYTSDADNANQAWGTFEHDGEIYGSATLGAEALAVKENCIYIWAYQTF